MRHFTKLGEMQVGPLMGAIARQPELWNQNTLRTKTPGTPHGEVDDIWLFFNDPEDPEAVVNDKEVIPFFAWHKLPQARQIIFDLMRWTESHRLGRVVITRLPPGGTIPMHTDGGAPATYFTRYQVAIQSLPGAIFQIEEEQVNFKTGEVWMINNEAEHGVINNSEDDRIVMIVDLRAD